MKKIILTYGILAGVIVSAMLLITQPMFRNGMLDHVNGVYVGFTTMIIALSLIFFGVKSYRDTHLSGVITFWQAFAVGILIALVASVMYAITWDLYLRFTGTDFAAWYNQAQLDELIKEGASEQELANARVEMDKFAEMYANPFIRFGFTLIEIFPVGLIITMVSAGLLRKKEFLPATR